MSNTEKFILFALLVIPIMFISMYCSTPKSEKKTVEQVESTDYKVAVNAPKKLRIAYTPTIEAGEVVEKNEILDRILSERLGIPVESSIIMSYVAAIQGLASGQIDCAMVSPLGYVLGSEKFPMDVILKVKRNGKTEYSSQIIVNVKSGIDTIEDLKGHSIAFVDRTSTSGHLYPRSFLLEQGLDIENDFSAPPIFVGSHDKVAIDVMNGVFDIGATYQDVRERVKEKYPEVMQKTKVIAVTRAIPNEMFCVSANLDPGFKMKLTEVLKEISVGVEIDGEIVRPLYDLDKIDELVPAKDSDYDPVREVIKSLDIDLLKEAEK
ncbi:MAG: phosphate/phosphite/phosphonate ABC transporter substrate-binding protein [bacterium]